MADTDCYPTEADIRDARTQDLSHLSRAHLEEALRTEAANGLLLLRHIRRLEAGRNP